MKYKLVKIFPGSVKLGEIVEYTGRGYTVGVPCTDYFRYFPREIVEDYPEFWEKVEEKTPEQGSNWKELHYKIMGFESVMRAKDDIIFKIGDKVYNPKCPTQKFTIEKFYLDCNDVHMLVEPEHININKIEHYKEPILITEDGISLFTNDLVWFITDNMYEVYYKHCNKDMSTKYKYFSTKAIAEKYIENNKPKFSKKELMDIIQLDTEQYDDGEVIEKLVKLIENK